MIFIFLIFGGLTPFRTTHLDFTMINYFWSFSLENPENGIVSGGYFALLDMSLDIEFPV